MAQQRPEVTLTSTKLNTGDKVWVVSSVTADKAKAFLKQAIRQKRLIQLLGSCHVEYHGRARSLLTEGERLIVLKRDGALLVHTANGVEPVNWQPPGATIKVTVKQDQLVLYVSRVKPRETVCITFSTILFISASILEDTGEFSMYLTEEEMQQVLSAHPELIEPGLRTIRRERPVTPGFIDIYARDTEGRIVVVEIKRRRADRNAVLQLHQYIKSIQASNEQIQLIRGILVAPSLTKGTHALLEQLGLEYRQIEPQHCYQYLRRPSSRRLTDYQSPE